MARPILVDPADGPCEICAAWEASLTAMRQKLGPRVDGRPPRPCARCGELVGVYENMFGAGFRSPRPHHFHLGAVEGTGVPGRVGMFEELCWDCYTKAFAEAYPNATCPDAPRQMMAATQKPLPAPDGQLLINGAVQERTTERPRAEDLAGVTLAAPDELHGSPTANDGSW